MQHTPIRPNGWPRTIRWYYFISFCVMGMMLMNVAAMAGITGDMLEYQRYHKELQDAEKLTKGLLAAQAAIIELPWEYSSTRFDKVKEIAPEDKVTFKINQINLDLSTLDSTENIFIEEVTWLLRRNIIEQGRRTGEFFSKKFAQPLKTHISVTPDRQVPRQAFVKLTTPLTFEISGLKFYQIFTEFNLFVENSLPSPPYFIVDRPFLRLVLSTDTGAKFSYGIPIYTPNRDDESLWDYGFNGHRLKHYAVSEVTHFTSKTNPYLPNKYVINNRFAPTYNDVLWSKRIGRILEIMAQDLKNQKDIITEWQATDVVSVAEINTGITQKVKDYQNYICAYRTPGTPTKVLPRTVCLGEVGLIDNSNLEVFTAIPFQHLLNNIDQIYQQIDAAYLTSAAKDTIAKLNPLWPEQMKTWKKTLQNLQNEYLALQEEIGQKQAD